MTDAFCLDNELHFLLRNASTIVGKFCQRSLRHCAITYAEYNVLSALWEQDGLLSGLLALRLGVNASTVSRAIKRLERAGLVRRQRDPADERTVRVWLTAAGREVQAKTQPLRERVAVLSGMTEEELAGMHRMVQRFQQEPVR